MHWTRQAEQHSPAPILPTPWDPHPHPDRSFTECAQSLEAGSLLERPGGDRDHVRTRQEGANPLFDPP
jgi:hypothetical protein